MTTCGTFPDPILSLRSRTASPLQDDSAKSLSSVALFDHLCFGTYVVMIRVWGEGCSLVFRLSTNH